MSKTSLARGASLLTDSKYLEAISAREMMTRSNSWPCRSR